MVFYILDKHNALQTVQRTIYNRTEYNFADETASYIAASMLMFLQFSSSMGVMSQRDSDVGKEVQASRAHAFAQFSTLELRTGSEFHAVNVSGFCSDLKSRFLSQSLP